MTERYRTFSEKYSLLTTPKGQKAFVVGTIIAVAIHWQYYKHKEQKTTPASLRFSRWLSQTAKYK